MILAVAKHIGPSQRAAATGQHNDFPGKTITIVNMTFFSYHSGPHINAVPAHNTFRTDKSITLYYRTPGRSAIKDILLTHIFSEPPNSR